MIESSPETGFQLSPRQKELYPRPGSRTLFLEVDGTLTAEELQLLMDRVLARHEILHTRFGILPGRRTPCQIIEPIKTDGARAHLFIADSTPGNVEDMKGSGSLTPESRPSWKMVSCPGDKVTRLALTLGGLTGDWSSFSILLNELAAAAGQPAQNPEDPFQYADYAAWQQECLENPATAKAPVETSVHFSASDDTGHARLDLGSPESIGTSSDTKRMEANCLAACYALVGRFTGLMEPLLGVALDGRRESELAGMIGPTEKIFPFQAALDLNFGNLVNTASKWLQDTSDSFDANFPQWEQEPEVRFQFIRLPVQVGNVDWQLRPTGILEIPGGRHRLSLTVVLQGHSLAVHVTANTNLASLSAEATALYFAEQFGHLLKKGRDELPVFGIPLLQATKKRPDPCAPVPAPSVIPVTEMIKTCSSRTPDAVALSGQNRDWTYAELQESSDLIAHTLLAHGLQSGDRVAVLGGKSFGMISSLFGTLLSGGVILPLDPSLPHSRMADMIQLAKVRFLIVVGEETISEKLSSCTILRFGVDGKPARGTGLKPDGPSTTLPKPDVKDPAYVLFTSGTTGKPKAVLGKHGGLAHFISWQGGEYKVTPADRVALLTAFSFDVVLRDIFLPLCHGATLCLPPDHVLGVPSIALDWLASSRVSLLHLVPSIADWWLGSAGSEKAGVLENSLRAVFFAGEPLHGRLAIRWRERFGQNILLVNLYGPTETTLAKCHYRVPKQPGQGVQPIGHPLPGAQVFIRNAHAIDCVPGEPGEILIRTPFHTEPLSPDDSGFFQNPSSPDPCDLFYRSGDLGWFREDGTLEIAGRADDQIKIRGVRISPLEIESTLSGLPGVDRCAVLVIADNPLQKKLVAFVSSKTGLDTENILAGLRSKLPAAMIPSRIDLIDRFPLTPHGKTDRRALLGLAREPEKVLPGNTCRPPTNEQERRLLEIWKELFQRQDIGIDDHFFELGGHSLIAARLAARLREQTGNDVPLHWIFEEPTVESLSARLSAEGKGPSVAQILPAPLPEGVSAPLSHSQLRIWLHDRLEPEAASYNIPISARLAGPLDQAKLLQSLGQIIRRHSILRTVFIEENGLPVQKVLKDWEIQLRSVDLKPEPSALREEKLRALALAETRHPFRTEEAPPIRALLVQTGAEEHVLLITLHHLVGDGWSSVLLLRELEDFYHGKKAPVLSFHYADFAAWDRSGRNSPLHSESLGYWQKRLNGFSTKKAFPTDFPRTAHSSALAEVVTIRLENTLAEDLRSLAASESATLFITLLAAFSSYLGRLTGREEITLGTPVANRPLRESEALIGCFINTLPMNVSLSAKGKFRELLSRVRAGVLEDFRHQHIPFEEIVRVVRPVRYANIHPVFQVLFNVLNFEPAQAPLSDLRFERIFPATPGSKFDWTVYVREGAHLEIQFLYDSRLFDPERMKARASGFRAYLSDLIANPAGNLSTFFIPPEALFPAAKTTEDHSGSRSGEHAPVYHANGAITQAVKASWLRHLPSDTLRDDQTNFFEAGGHSLMAMEIAYALEKTLGLRVPLRLFLEFPTIQSLSGELSRSAGQDSGNARPQAEEEWKL